LKHFALQESIMTRKPPVPDASKAASASDEEHESEALAAVREMAEAKKRWSPTRKQIGMGAAIGVGSAAVVAALLYWRGGKK
jgi:uncharacterized protein (UPF0254 family)